MLLPQSATYWSDSFSAALHGYEAGEPEARAEELNAAFADPGVKAIFCLRGGNSACRVLEHVNLDAIQAGKYVFDKNVALKGS